MENEEFIVQFQIQVVDSLVDMEAVEEDTLVTQAMAQVVAVATASNS